MTGSSRDDVARSRTRRLATRAGTVGLRWWGHDAPDVVLVHGAGGNRDSLAPLGDALAAAGLGVVAVSLPARGGSEGPPVTSVQEAADWLGAVLAEIAPDGAVVLGHSMGGGVAIETALTTPDRVRALVLAATRARLRVHPGILDSAATAASTGDHLAELSAAALRPDGPPEVRAHLLAADSATPGPVALADWRAVDGFDRLADVDGLTMPVLVVGGEQDHLTPPRYATFLADAAPTAELLLLPDAGHWLPLEDTHRVAEAVVGFVRGLGA